MGAPWLPKSDSGNSLPPVEQLKQLGKSLPSTKSSSTLFSRRAKYSIESRSKQVRRGAPFHFRLVFDLSFVLSLSKGRPFMVRQAHHERTTRVTLNNEKSLVRRAAPFHTRCVLSYTDSWRTAFSSISTPSPWPSGTARKPSFWSNGSAMSPSRIRDGVLSNSITGSWT